MNNSQINHSSAYVEVNTLTDWSTKINEINESANSILDTLLVEIEGLNEYWEGNLANGFIKDSSERVLNIKKIHEDMKSVPHYLIDVINTMKNQ